VTTKQTSINKKKKSVSGTKEWAKYNENLISGCSHDCRYCYAKQMAIRFRRTTASSWEQEIISVLKITRPFKKKEGRIMFPTTHDITPDNLDFCMAFLGNILESGNEVLVVSKPHIECIQTICKRFQEYKTYAG